MSRRLRLLAIALAGWTIAACADGGERDAPDPVPNETGIRADLLHADSTFARETAAGGAEAWASWFEPEGSMVRGTGEIVGRSTIREAMTPFLSDTTVRFRWSPERAIVDPDGDLGATIGSYRITSADSVGAVLERGMYLSVWRRGPDGSWKVVADIGTPAPPE